MIEAIEDGFFVREIADSAEQYQREIETKDRITVGVNEYVSDDKLDIPLLEIDGEGERRHLKRLDSVRRERDTGRVTATLERLRQARSRGRESDAVHTGRCKGLCHPGRDDAGAER